MGVSSSTVMLNWRTRCGIWVDWRDMNRRQGVPGRSSRGVLVVAAIVIGFGDALAHLAAAQAAKPSSAPAPSGSTAPAQGQATKIPPDQLDSLVAPIALYPDPLLAQVLAASTYPLEI